MKLKRVTPFPFGVKAPRPELTKAISFGRMDAVAVLFLVVGLVGCRSAFGSLHFEGSDPMGPFSGDIDAYYCLGSFQGTGVTIRGTRDSIDTGTEASPFVFVGTKGASWWLRPSDCRTLDLRLWFDGDKHQHVAVRVDCTTQGVHVTGSVWSDRCYIKRPGMPAP